MQIESNSGVAHLPLHEGELLAQVYDAIIATGVNGEILLWNVGAERIYGYSASEVLGRDIRLLFFPEDAYLLDQAVLSPLRTSGLHETTLRIRRKDGEEIFVSLRVSVLCDERGSVIGSVGCSNDITEQWRRKQLEDEKFGTLTPRHREVMQLLAEGCATKEIAFRIHVSAKTVEFHKYELMRRLGVHSTAGLTAIAMKHGLIAV